MGERDQSLASTIVPISIAANYKGEKNGSYSRSYLALSLTDTESGLLQANNNQSGVIKVLKEYSLTDQTMTGPSH